MNKEDEILDYAEKISESLKMHCRYIAENAESGFELNNTCKYVCEVLKRMGLEPIRYGKCGIGVDICGKEEGRCFLLRADMDALKGIEPNAEQRCIHACGHHMHTAMLLGAAEILIRKNGNFRGRVRLMFQGAEELLEGACDMIDNGILEDPVPDGAMMLHVMSGVDMPCGNIVVSSEGITAPAADFFRITVKGNGTHGALSYQGVDTLTVATYILTALHEINSRELMPDELISLTVGKLEGANVANVIPDVVVLEGSLRTFKEETRTRIKKRICEISEYISLAFRAKSDISFIRGCPSLQNSRELSEHTFNCLSELFGKERVILSKDLKIGAMSGGSEDFSYVSQRIPSIMIGVCAGNKADGYRYPLHHPYVSFDDRVLGIGAAAYAYTALRFLDL